MAYDGMMDDDAAALKQRRGSLRAFSEQIADIIAQMPLPETYLEAERGARAIWVADRAIVRLKAETLGDGEAGSNIFSSPVTTGEVSSKAAGRVEMEGATWIAHRR